MPSPRNLGTLATLAVGLLALGTGLTGCGGSSPHVAIPPTTLKAPRQHRPSGSAIGGVAPSSTSTTAEPAAASPTTTSGAGPGAGTGPATGSTVAASTTTTAPTPACATDGLTIAVSGPTDPGAGSASYVLTFVNRGTASCTLSGFAGVSAVDASGNELGPAATRTSTSGQVVTLAPQATASAVLRLAQAEDYPTGACDPTAAAGFRVFPPDQTASVTTPTSVQVCAGDEDDLQINPIVPGVASG